jgi:hypothetical protein
MGATVVVACLATVLAATSFWVHRTLLDTNQYVRVVKPIGNDSTVDTALGAYLSQQLLEVVNAQKVISDALPEGGRILAGPLANAVRTFIQDQITKLLHTDAFQQAWVVANRTAHATAVAVLRDRTGTNVVRTSNGKVALNLLPLINEALRRLQDASPDILGHQVQLPEIKPQDIPADARQRIQDALGVTLPGDFGQIVLFDSDQLRTAQDLVRWFDRANVVLIAAAILLLAFTIWVSHRRRRTIMQVGVGIAIGLIVFRRLAVVVRNDIVKSVSDPVYRKGTGSALDHILGSYFSFTAWLIFLGLAAAFIAFVSAPTPRARDLRAGTRRLLREAAAGLARLGAEHGDDPILHWIQANHVALQVGGVALVLLLVVVVSPSLISLVLLILLMSVYEFVLYFLSGGRVPGHRELTAGDQPDSAPALKPVAIAELSRPASSRDPLEKSGDGEGRG